ncbi:SPOR domain-containing protein [Massilia sp. GCM10023247]|uniref:SPOR domain-containing protein n=1 Tax=Massilia sp. GCM10023247 TaxID=3252643 RepID=UPI00361E6469
MGLFSIFSKNKQDSTAQESGRFSRDDDGFGQQARSKRASYANEAGAGGSRRSRSGGDPMLPEKKRARRRLVGAVALALAAAVGLPMLLDSEPRPLAGDIDIQIPSKEKAPALPMPAAPVVAAADSVDQDEEIIAPPPLAASAPAAAVAPPAKTAGTADPAGMMTDEEPPRPQPEVKRSAPEPKPVERKPEPKHEPKPEPKPERRAADKAPEKPVEKPAPKKAEEKPAAPRSTDAEAARALALLEGKSAAKPAEKAEAAEKKPEAAQRYVVQVAALATEEKVAELQARLRGAGVSSTTRKSGALIKVQVGPFGSREEAEKMRAKLGGLGIGGFLVPV